MKIAILGTKGIPNNYGGFEQFAEDLSVRLVKLGYDVTVYNPSFHSYSQQLFKGVKIRVIYSPEQLIGGAANFIYDHLCLADALKNKFDIIYEAGYHSVALSYAYFNIKKLHHPIIITNMDGLEWKRSKWNPMVRRFIKFLERKAVQYSPYLISDNVGIQDYYRDKFKKKSFFIPYGAQPVVRFEESSLNEYGLTSQSYLLVIARLEPENNIETILHAYMLSGSSMPLVIIGNAKTKYGMYLRSKYPSGLIKFIGGIYNKASLDSIRHFSFAYFHGHSVGGTNPSLLEAMATRCFIISHSNPFNKSVLNDNALYFKDAQELVDIVRKLNEFRSLHFFRFTEANFGVIGDVYNWDLIAQMHDELFHSLIAKSI